MIDVNTFLLMLVYMLCAILLVCLIVFTIKLIGTLNKVNGIIDDVDKKIAKLDKAFNLVDIVTDNMALVSDKIVDSVSGIIRKLFNKKKIGKVDDINE